MSNTQMDPAFSAALRAGLVEHVAQSRGVRRRHRVWLGLGVFAGVGLVGGGAAVATGLWVQPGADVDEPLAASVSVTRAGSAVVELGTPPAGANSISLALTCLTAGRFTFADGASMGCDESDLTGRSGTSWYTMPLTPGQHTTSIGTTDNARWTLTVTYVVRRPTDWATNDSGETYGAANDRGAPDLVAVIATDGTPGYAFESDLAAAEGPNFTSPEQALAWQEAHQGESMTVPVYASDGKTVIGEFSVGG
ncbi:MAG: peptidase M56 family protein [Cellulomonas sp.]